MAWRVCNSFQHHSRALLTSFVLLDSRAFIDLSECNNLRKLRLHNIRLVDSTQREPFGTRWARKLISQIPSPHVEEITFSFSEYKYNHGENLFRNIEAFDWQGVGNALESLEQLRRFTVELCDLPFGVAPLEGFFRTIGLHDLAARGLLEFCYP